MWYTRKIAQNNATNGVYEYPLNMPISGELQKLLIKLSSDGHLALVVGGAVRDSLMGIKPKDIDIEVYGFLPSEEFLALGEQWDNITNQIKYTDPSSPEYKNLEKEFEKIRKLYAESSPMADLADELRRFPQFGKLAESEGGVVGKSFGVIKFIDKSGQDYDFSLPRKESKTGGGHASFRPVFGDFTPMEAAARRDFTFNSMGYDPLNGQLYDYFGGREDINNGIIRHTSPAFIEDPLRVLRGMQFSSRMGFEVAPETAQLCKEIMQMFTNNRAESPRL